MEILLIGAQRGIEARVLPEKGWEHKLLPLEPFYRARPWRNWRLLGSAIRSSRDINRVFRSFAPDLVVGTGGYVSGPVVGWAIARKLRTAVQEQNSYPGLTTRWLAPYVDQLHLGYVEALDHLWPGPDTEVQAHGNPIRWPKPQPEARSARQRLGLGEGRVVLVVGGSQGAAGLNAALLSAIEAVERGELRPLPADVEVLWSTGPAHHADLSKAVDAVSGDLKPKLVPYITEMEEALSVTTLAVSRAGALALSELCAWEIPSVLVPLPHAVSDHQSRNARALQAAGAAMVIEEDRASRDPGSLWEAMLDLLEDGRRLERMSLAAGARGNRNAAREIADDLLRLVEDR